MGRRSKGKDMMQLCILAVYMTGMNFLFSSFIFIYENLKKKTIYFSQGFLFGWFYVRNLTWSFLVSCSS